MAVFKTRINVVGVGSRLTGEGKKGAYDIVPVSFTFEDPYHGTSGVLADSCVLGYNDFCERPVAAGQEYYAFVNYYKGNASILSILE